MEVATIESDDGKKSKAPLNLVYDESSDNYLRSWPVALPVPMKTLYLKGARHVRRKPYVFKYSMKNFAIPLDGQMSMDHIHFLLDCFVVSAGPDPPQLGRYHPQSDPEEFVPKPQPEDTWSLKAEDEEDDFWAKVGVSKLKPPLAFQDAGSSSWSDENFEDAPYEIAAPSSPAKSEPARTLSPVFAEDVIVRELSEMRSFLERLLDNHEVVEWGNPNGFPDVLDMLPENIIPSEPSPPYPVGEWEFDSCGICFDGQWLYRRACCGFPACSNCLQSYFSTKIDDGQVKIECCSTTCNSYIHRDEISARLSAEYKEKFHKLLILANQDANTKTCPRCSHVTKAPTKAKHTSELKYPSVICPSCELEWCFDCHAPSHEPLSCKQFQKGDRLLRTWARERNHGQLNAQRCPKCKIYIQRTTGCDHMHCTRCKTNFCYKCGERFRYLKFFGDHYSKLSVFGCKYRFKADQPVQRKLIRGAIFGGKLIAAPVLGALALCAGALAVGISLFALPVYGGVRLYRHCEGRQTAKALRRHSPYHFCNLSLQERLVFPET